MSTLIRVVPLVSVLLLGWLSTATASEDEPYAFEMLIFERPDGVDEIVPRDPELPLAERRKIGSLEQQETVERRLDAVATTLKRKGMRILRHDAWQQVPVARNSNSWFSIDNGQVSGLVRVARGRFLHLDAELFLPGMDPLTMQPIRLKRRFRSEELHYLDHPRVGILIQAEPVEPAGSERAASKAMIEPRPAEPQSGSGTP